MPANTFTLIEISDESIIAAVKKLNMNGSSGNEEIYPIFVKKSLCYIVEPLKTIYRASSLQGRLPQCWKEDIICPIYKNNGRPHECSSYRPIRLTSIICKILEHIVHDQLLLYLTRFEIITTKQHGFIS